ncbi:MAG TPA: MHYT domain-containing protein [Candidatus Acidoferrum sp.]|nr:MHYT domain-containing protein [Candidatus Acidoferrum sp.]
MVSNLPVITGSYDYPLVALSVLIAVFASYAALNLAERVSSTRCGARSLRLASGATAMGIGVWSMHYVGMLAFRLPVPVEYDWPTVFFSLLAAIAASAAALFVASRESMGIRRAAAASVFMGAAIACMQYMGMATLRVHAERQQFQPSAAKWKRRAGDGQRRWRIFGVRYAGQDQWRHAVSGIWPEASAWPSGGGAAADNSTVMGMLSARPEIRVVAKLGKGVRPRLGNSDRKFWRRGGDSNPRYKF